MKYEICKGNYNMLGIDIKGTVITCTVENKKHKECMLVLHPKKGGKIQKIPMQPDVAQTALYSVGLRNLPWQEYDYSYEIDGTCVIDPYAKLITGREIWGDLKRKEIKCGFYKSNFSWGDDCLPRIPKEDMMMYKLHVRGFSMQQKLAQKEQGTFQGISRKLSYLKELGITTVEMMPVYEFEELFAKDSFQHEVFPENKINYWGYTRGNYFAVKSSYLGEGNTPDTFKQLVRKMHRNNMECILEFYFDKELNPHFIIEVLRYWAKEYHVDGFHVICDKAVAELIAKDVRLSGRKLFFEWFEDELCNPKKHEMELYSYNDAFLYGVRKLMNHQGGSVGEFTDQMRRQHMNQGFVNYLANNNGFTLYDVFSYGERHNQDNGEENRDGIQWNFSNNCGEEGPTKRKYVQQLREKQVKNGLCTVMLAQGVPLIWMGDECGNTQNGNNNAYCQDNEIGWKNWDTTKKSRNIRNFLKELSALRRKYPALRNPIPMELCDYKGVGYPDLSYHGDNGWRMGPEENDKSIGMMYSCKYAQEDKKLKDDYIYVGYNFSARDQVLALPALPKKYRWYYVLDTGVEQSFEERPVKTDGKVFSVHRQSVCVLAGRREE